MTTADEIETAARRLFEARRTCRPLASLSPPRLGAAADAYAIQRRVADALGPVGAFKTGRKTRDEPLILAPVQASTVRPSPARFGRDELRLFGVELEVAFRIESTLPAPEAPGFADAARAAVRPLPAIEVVDSRLADHESADPLWKLADDQLNGGLVVGEPLTDGAMPLERLHARLEVDGEPVFDRVAEVPGGDAFEIFLACARTIGEHCGGLQPGRFVTTGSLTGLRFVDFGTTVTGTIDGLGAVRVTFA